MEDPSRGATTPKQAMLFSVATAIAATAYCIHDGDIVPHRERPLQRIVCEKVKFLTYCLADLSVFERSAGGGAPISGNVTMEESVHSSTRVDIGMRFYFEGNYLSMILELKVPPHTTRRAPLATALQTPRTPAPRAGHFPVQ